MEGSSDLDLLSVPMAGPSVATLHQPPPLPSELVLLIIRHALPPTLATNAFRKRYDVLLSCQLVCRAWASLAQAELYRHVHLPTLDAVAAFHQSPGTEKESGPLLRYRRTRTLRLGGPQPAPQWDDAQDHSLPVLPSLWKVLFECTGLEELHITGMVVLDYADLSVASGLVSLHLDNVSMQPLDHHTRPYLPKLQYLSTSRVATWTPRGAASWGSDFIKSSCFPALTRMALRWYPSVSEEEDDDATTPTFGRLTDSLDTIVLGRHTSTLLADHLRTELADTTSLRHFTLNTPEFLHLYLRDIPSHLESLQIGAHYFRRDKVRFDRDYILPALLDLPESIKHLKRLSLPEVFMWGWRGRLRERTDPTQPAVKKALEARDEVRSVCKARGIELVERKLTEDGEDFPVDHWKEVLEW